MPPYRRQKIYYVPGLPPLVISELTLSKPTIPSKPTSIGTFRPPETTPGGMIYKAEIPKTLKLRTDYTLKTELLIGITKDAKLTTEYELAIPTAYSREAAAKLITDLITEVPPDRWITGTAKLATEVEVPPPPFIEIELPPIDLDYTALLSELREPTIETTIEYTALISEVREPIIETTIEYTAAIPSTSEATVETTIEYDAYIP